MVRRSLCATIMLANVWVCATAQTKPATTMQNQAMSISVGARGTTFRLFTKDMANTVFTSRVGAEINHRWLWSTDYPVQKITQVSMQDVLGSGHRITITLSGLSNGPDLIYTLELYDNLPFGDIQVYVKNTGQSSITVQDIRVIDIVDGSPRVDLGGPEASERVLSDSFSEDRPPLHIFDLGKARRYEGEDSYSDALTNIHFAVGSQLIYNRDSHYSLLIAALTADKWLTLYHLNTQSTGADAAQVLSYAVDCTGTTEVMDKESLRDDPPKDQSELSLPLDAGHAITSEKIMLSVGRDYHAQLESYGMAIRQLRHALVSKQAPWGWWSWTAYYFGLSESTALTNAEWLAQNLRPYGFNYFHIDEGYAYADGEYVTPNAMLFPDGVRQLGHRVSEFGLNFGIWVAPFRVSKRAWVYEKHPEWLVHDLEGHPIQIGYVEGSHDALYVLDTTHPGAQMYLRETYQTLARSWNVRYIKMDFMDDTAIEGYHYRPNTTAIEAEQIGLKVIRDAVGPDILLDKDGSPMLPAVGYTDLGRISTDTGHSYKGMREDATGIAARYYMNGNFYGADPDAFTVTKQLITDQSWHQSKAPLTVNEAEVSVTLAAIAGGMFEIGDDLPTLGAEPERLALVQNKDLLDMVHLGRAAQPVDLMTYSPEDGQPSIFFLKEDDRQAMLAVFNWTDKESSDAISLQNLGYIANGNMSATDVFRRGRTLEIAKDTLRITSQPHSVHLIKLIDNSVSAKAPVIDVSAPKKAKIGQNVEFRAIVNPRGTPATQYHWDFGDGTSQDGTVVHHAYTRDNTYAVTLRVDGLDGVPTTHAAEIVVEGTLKTTYEVRDYRRYQEDTHPIVQQNN
jgi:alpha-galactosidase